jgi:hypothetical protein
VTALAVATTACSRWCTPTGRAPSVTVGNTAPTVSITFPTAGSAGGWAAGCSTALVADVCGTATEATGGVAKVQVSFRQSAAPSLYWTGVLVGDRGALECDPRVAVLVVPDGGGRIHERDRLHAPRARD